MATPAYPSVSLDKVDQEVHNFEQTPAAQPAIVQQQNAAVVPPAPTMGKPPVASAPPAAPASSPAALEVPNSDLKGMGERVLDTHNQLQQNIPKPALPIDKDTALAIGAGVAALTAGAYGINKYSEMKAAKHEKSIAARRMNATPMMDLDTSEPHLGINARPSDMFGEQKFVPEVDHNFVPENPVEAEIKKQVVPTNPPVPLNTEVGVPPKTGMPLVEQGSKNARLKEEVANIKTTTETRKFERNADGSIKYPEKMSKAAKEGADLFTVLHPEHAATLEAQGKFGILRGGAGDNSLHNVWGSDVMKEIRQNLFEGQMVGSDERYKAFITPSLKELPPESEFGKKLAKIREEQPMGATHGKLGVPATITDNKIRTGKNLVPGAIKAGAPALLLMSIADAAKANTAREAIGNVAESLLPMGISPSTLEAGTLYTPEQQKAFTKQLAQQQAAERQKLGSPFRAVPPPR
jgi:hypothetical protein